MGLMDYLNTVDEENVVEEEKEREDSSGTEKQDDKTKELLSKIEQLENKNKELDELVRQQAEKINSIPDFKRLLNPDKVEKEKLQEEELAMFEEDPLSYLENKFQERLKEFKDELTKKEVDKAVSSAIEEIKRDYDINFDVVYPKVVEELNNFSAEVKKKDPKGVLLKACSLAGVLKPKKKPTTNYITGEGIYSSMPTVLKNKEDIVEKIRKRILGTNKKSNNIFGV